MAELAFQSYQQAQAQYAEEDLIAIRKYLQH